MPKLEGASGPWGTRGAAPVRQRHAPATLRAPHATLRELSTGDGEAPASSPGAKERQHSHGPEATARLHGQAPTLPEASTWESFLPENVPGRAPPHREAGTLRCDLTCVSHTTVTTLSTRRMPCGADSSLSKDDNFPLCLSE